MNKPAIEEPKQHDLDQEPAVKNETNNSKNQPNPTNKQQRHNVGEIAALTGAAASTVSIAAAASGACLSGACAVASMTAAGGVLGASAALGPVAIAGAPAYLGAKTINHLAFKDKDDLKPDEANARNAARRVTNIGAIVGIAGTTMISLSRGIKTAAVISKLGSVGSLVGGGAMTGAVLLAALPIATAGAFGAVAYYWHTAKKTEQTSYQGNNLEFQKA